MSITTGKGDEGWTGLADGKRVPKDAPRLEVLGQLDMLVSLLGVVRFGADEETAGELRLLQEEVMQATGWLAGSRAVGPPQVSRLDEECARLEGEIELPDDFVLPGASRLAAELDVARAAARTCERRLAALAREEPDLCRPLRAWMNRVSDYLWLLARRMEGR